MYAALNGVPDPSPATATWVVDLTAPTVPTNLVAATPLPTAVPLSWGASTDTGGSGLAGYTVLRDGATLATLGLVTSYTDSTVAAGSTHTYNVRARDAAGNLSALSNTLTVTTPAGPAPDTIIDTRPATPSNSTTATFTFHSTITPATFTCTLDGVAAACTSPMRPIAGSPRPAIPLPSTPPPMPRPTPAPRRRPGWWTSPRRQSRPTSWPRRPRPPPCRSAGRLTDTGGSGLAGYTVVRDGVTLATLGLVTSYTDTTVTGATTHTYNVRARDAAGNISALSNTVTVTTPPGPAPHTIIDTKPANPSNLATPNFTFHSTITPATFTCTLDGVAAACTSPKAYSGLTQASHTFTVYATAGGSPDLSPASFTWLVDLTAPTVPTNLVAATPSPTAVPLSRGASTDTGGSGLAGYTVVRDGATLATLGLVTSYTDSAATAGSTHTYTVRARDAAGNLSALSNSVTVITPNPLAPDTLIHTGPRGIITTTTTATFTFHSTRTPATFTCKLDAGVAAACTSPKSYSGLTDGSHTFTVYAFANGYPDPTPATATWAVDLLPPTVPTGVAATSATCASVALTWLPSTDTSGVTGYDVYRNETLLTSLAAVTSYTDSGVTKGVTYQYTVRAKDFLGAHLGVELPRAGHAGRPV